MLNYEKWGKQMKYLTWSQNTRFQDYAIWDAEMPSIH